MTTVRQLAKPKVYLWPDGKRRARIDLSSMVTAFQYTKAMHEPCGRWSVSLMPSQGANVLGAARGPAHITRPMDIERECRPNAVVSIGWDEPGGIMIGLVDEVRRTGSRSGPTTSLGLTITGCDFGKMLAMDHIVHASLTVAETPKFLLDVGAVVGQDHALLQALPGVWGPQDRDGVPTFLGASIQTVIDWLIKTGPSMQVPLLAHAGGTGRPGEFLDTTSSITSWNDGRIWSEAPHTFQGSLWDFIKKILDEDFYEVFIDSVPNGTEIPLIKLTIRPKPFDEDAIKPLPVPEMEATPGTKWNWERLKTRIDGKKEWEIPEFELLSEDLGISDADVFSYFLVTSEHELIGNPDGLAEGLFYPAVDLFALTRAGLRSYEGRLSLLAADLVAKQAGTTDYDREVGEEVVEFRNRLFNWYRLSEYFESGSVTVAGRDRYRIGDPVLLPWRTPMRGDAPGCRYYCVSTTHAWTLGRPYTTTLRLMRGHNASVIDRANLEILVAGGTAGNPSMLAEVS